MMGFDFFANDAEIDLVFNDLDEDKSGKITYKELNAKPTQIFSSQAGAAEGEEHRKWHHGQGQIQA